MISADCWYKISNGEIQYIHGINLINVIRLHTDLDFLVFPRILFLGDFNL